MGNGGSSFEELWAREATESSLPEISVIGVVMTTPLDMNTKARYSVEYMKDPRHQSGYRRRPR